MTLGLRDHHVALDEFRTVLDDVDEADFNAACTQIAKAGKVVLYGCGREGLQIRGLAMRLYHLGLNATMVGDMATPPLGKGDLFLVSSGPGDLSTVAALMDVAHKTGADVLYLTANPDTPESGAASHVLTIPAQTMVADQRAGARSVLPMGSVYEGALFVLFEMMVLRLREQMGIDPDAMRGRHTNME